MHIVWYNKQNLDIELDSLHKWNVDNTNLHYTICHQSENERQQVQTILFILKLIGRE